MPLRPTLLIGTSGPLHGMMQAALQSCTDDYHAEIAWSGAIDTKNAGAIHCQSLVQLLARRPDLVVAENFGPAAFQATAFRMLYRKSRLLLLVTASGPISAVERLIVRSADGVMAHASAAESIMELGIPPSRVFPVVEPFDAGPFGSCPGSRSGNDAYRLVYQGDLVPEAGVLDFLLCAASWAEQNPTRPVDIWWIGEGDLRGVLEAQPTPANLSQRFLGKISVPETVDAFAQCGMLIVPTLSESRPSPVAEAMAAGLLVIGSLRDSTVQKIVHDGETGWLFDPYSASGLFQAFDRAFQASPYLLDHMRSTARTTIASMSPHSFVERVSAAVSTIVYERDIHNDAAIAAS